MTEVLFNAIYPFDTYQEDCGRTAQYPGMDDETGMAYVTLGLCGESGEVAEKVKKALRDHGGHIDASRRDALIQELGDVLWYVARLATHLHVSMAEVARRNITKLQDRMDRGVLSGSGDNR